MLTANVLPATLRILVRCCLFCMLDWVVLFCSVHTWSVLSVLFVFGSRSDRFCFVYRPLGCSFSLLRLLGTHTCIFDWSYNQCICNNNKCEWLWCNHAAQPHEYGSLFSHIKNRHPKNKQTNKQTDHNVIVTIVILVVGTEHGLGYVSIKCHHLNVSGCKANVGFVHFECEHNVRSNQKRFYRWYLPKITNERAFEQTISFNSTFRLLYISLSSHFSFVTHYDLTRLLPMWVQFVY
jgi:hypothetical protein